MPQHHRNFYTDLTIRDWFKSYVRTILERVNPQTGVAYRDDPTILAGSWPTSPAPATAPTPTATVDPARGR
ncbi:MAG: hypothetical protein WKF43_17260 [Acidimicrobiales bacterium]